MMARAQVLLLVLCAGCNSIYGADGYRVASDDAMQGDGGACTPGCLATASSCKAACASAQTTCDNGCSNPGCKSKCSNDYTTCTNKCTTSCVSCDVSCTMTVCANPPAVDAATD